MTFADESTGIMGGFACAGESGKNTLFFALLGLTRILESKTGCRGSLFAIGPVSCAYLRYGQRRFSPE